MSIKKALDKITKTEQSLKALYVEALNATFKDCPELKSFELELCEQYDDNNYYYTAGIKSVNGVDLPEILEESYMLEEIENEEENSADWKKSMMASKTKIETLKAIFEVVDAIPSSYFENSYNSLRFTAPTKPVEKKKKTTKAKV